MIIFLAIYLLIGVVLAIGVVPSLPREAESVGKAIGFAVMVFLTIPLWALFLFIGLRVK